MSVLMFGGVGLASGTRLGDLWELDARGQWTQHHAQGPGTLDHHAAAFDTVRGRLVVYGGQDSQRAWNTVVWEWDGKVWRGIDATPGPGPRAHHAMTFDSRRGRTVLVGGFGISTGNLGGVWEWDGQSWRQFAAEGPKPRARHRLAYDAERGVTVLFGGDAGNPAPGKFEVMNETWLWSGHRWDRATPAASPPAVMFGLVAYDPRRKRVVLQAGADTWEWDGTIWRQLFQGGAV
jgi:hypothetical protein